MNARMGPSGPSGRTKPDIPVKGAVSTKQASWVRTPRGRLRYRRRPGTCPATRHTRGRLLFSPRATWLRSALGVSPRATWLRGALGVSPRTTRVRSALGGAFVIGLILLGANLGRQEEHGQAIPDFAMIPISAPATPSFPAPPPPTTTAPVLSTNHAPVATRHPGTAKPPTSANSFLGVTTGTVGRSCGQPGQFALNAKLQPLVCTGSAGSATWQPIGW